MFNLFVIIIVLIWINISGINSKKYVSENFWIIQFFTSQIWIKKNQKTTKEINQQIIQ